MLTITQVRAGLARFTETIILGGRRERSPSMEWVRDWKGSARHAYGKGKCAIDRSFGICHCADGGGCMEDRQDNSETGRATR